MKMRSCLSLGFIAVLFSAANLFFGCEKEGADEKKIINKAIGSNAPNMLQPLQNNCRLPERDLRRNSRFLDDAANYAIYAILSNNAYDKEMFRLPEEWRPKNDFKVEGEKTGIALKIFERASNGKIEEVVIAFRGTESRDINDWITNLVPGFRLQMEPAERNFERLLKEYEGQNVRFIATGHSLGGGLALHLSFRYPNVEAIVFNASPITKPGPRTEREANRRINIWETKEILAPIRAFARARWEGVENVPLRFQSGINQHGIYPLAVNMLKLGCESRSATATTLKLLLDKNCHQQ